MKKLDGKRLLVGALVLQLAGGCADLSQVDPRQTVISMFGAMEKNDEAALAHLLDLAELMKETGEDYSLNTDQPRLLTSPTDILKDMTNDGETKSRWFAYQRIVNKAEIMGETATVEVTFVDKGKSVGYRTHFGLHKVQGKWKIYSFKTLSDANEREEGDSEEDLP